MNEEYKHTFKNYKAIHILVKKLELDFLALKERKEGSAASTACSDVNRELRKWKIQHNGGCGYWECGQAGGLDPE